MNYTYWLPKRSPNSGGINSLPLIKLWKLIEWKTYLKISYLWPKINWKYKIKWIFMYRKRKEIELNCTRLQLSFNDTYEWEMCASSLFIRLKTLSRFCDRVIHRILGIQLNSSVIARLWWMWQIIFWIMQWLYVYHQMKFPVFIISDLIDLSRLSVKITFNS